MRKTLLDKVKGDRTKRFGLMFDSINEFDDFNESYQLRLPVNIETVAEQVVSQNSEGGWNWYGDNITSGEQIRERNKTFTHLNTLNNLVKKASSELHTRLKSKIGDRKLEANSIGLGIFSYDLASAGLMLRKEYYSEVLEMIVNPDYVIMEGEDFYYECDVCEPRASKHIVEQRNKLNAQGEKEYYSTTQKTYLDFTPRNEEAKNSKSKFVHLIMSTGFSGGTAASLIYFNSIAPSIISSMLSNYGYKIKVTLISGTRDNNNRSVLSVKVKDYNQSADINTVALGSGDARFFRCDLFKGEVVLFDMYNEELDSGGFDHRLNSFGSNIPLAPEIHNQWTHRWFCKGLKV